MRRLGLGCAISLVVACRGGAVAPVVVTPTMAPGDATVASEAIGAPLMTRVAELSQQLREHGVRLGGVASRGFITHGTEVTTAFEVPAGGCLSVVSMASPGVHDLDAHLFDPNGSLVVEDVERDAHPTVQLCAAEARRVYHVIEAFDGEGAYLVAGFLSDSREGLDAVARAVGGHPGTAGSAGAGGSDLERRLNELRDGISHRGFVPTGDTQRGEFARPGAQRFPVPVTPDRCYTLAALGDGEVRDVDLSVLDASGDEIARDVRPERDGMVQLCPATAQTLSVEVRVRAGGGSVLLSTFAAEAAGVGGVNALWLGERMSWGASATPLAQAIEDTTRALTTAGFTRTGTFTRWTLSPAEAREESVMLEGGRCAVIAAVAGRGVGALRLEVFDAAGERLARGRPLGGASVAVLCPPARETVRAVAVPEAGNGEAALGVFLGSTVPTWVAGSDRAAVSEVYGEIVSAQAQGWQLVGAPERARIGGQSQRLREVDRAAGRCVRVTGSGGRGSPWIQLAVRDASGRRPWLQVREGSATVVRCGAAAEHLRAEVRTDPPGAPEGDGFVTVFERAEASEPQGDAPGR